MGFRRSSLMDLCLTATFAGVLVESAYATDLYDAANAGNVGRIQQLLTSGANPNIGSPYDGPLHVGARLGSTEIVVDLLDAGADPELPGFGGAHPLHAAALAHKARIISVLLERGAKVDALDNVGRTPLMTDLSSGDPDLETLTVLLEGGANSNLLDGVSQIYALHFAAMHGRADVVELLLKFKANVDAKVAENGQSVLHFAIAHCHAATNGNVGVVEVLLEHGADVNAKDINGNTPLDFANMYAPNSGQLHSILVKAGAN